MRISAEKSRFFKKSVSFLGFIVTYNGAAIDPEKVRAIKEFLEPKNVFEVRSFLGLARYYRCFIKDFASIARPISDILKGENGSRYNFPKRNNVPSRNYVISLLLSTSSSDTLTIKKRLI